MTTIQSFPRDLRSEELREFVQHPTPTFLEIGCNDGTDTNRLLLAFPRCHIYCFEPDPRAIARFYRTVYNERATLVEIALSDRGGIATFHGSAGQPPRKVNHYCRLAEWDLSGSLCTPTGHLSYSPWVTFPKDRRFQVETMRLDDWVSQNPQLGLIDFIWADVQGAEAMLIRGASQTLLGTRYFYTEYYDKPMYEGQPNLAKIQEMLPTFELVATYASNALFRNTHLS